MSSHGAPAYDARISLREGGHPLIPSGTTQFGRVLVHGERSTHAPTGPTKGELMLWTIAVVLLVLWLLGLMTAYTMGGFIHVLLVIAIVVTLMRVIQGRRPI